MSISQSHSQLCYKSQCSVFTMVFVVAHCCYFSALETLLMRSTNLW